MGARSLPPGRYFRMHMIGYFEGIDSERGIVWRCSDSLSLREFLRLSSRDLVTEGYSLPLQFASLLREPRIELGRKPRDTGADDVSNNDDAALIGPAKPKWAYGRKEATAPAE